MVLGLQMSLGFKYLVVATATQCCIYNTSNWNTPHIFDLKETVNLILQCEKCVSQPRDLACLSRPILRTAAQLTNKAAAAQEIPYGGQPQWHHSVLIRGTAAV